jgi:glycosyltransferase involved in cell wall biosynthesis
MKESAGRVLMFVENTYPHDTRVRNEADALTEAGYSVTVVALQRKGQLRSEVVNQVQVYRLPRLEFFRKTPRENATLFGHIFVKLKSLIGYFTEYFYFTTVCLGMSIYVGVKRGFDIIHAHNPPDTLWIVALPWKLVGKKFIYDHHDLCPELYCSRYGISYGFLARVLKWIEWGNLKLANITIATNDSYKEIQIQRGGRKPEKIFVVRNGPNQDRMELAQPSRRLREMEKNILCYIGCLNPQDGVDYLLRALHHLAHDLKRDDFHCIIIGTGDSFDGLRSLAKQLGLNDYVEFTDYVSDEELCEYLAAADICVDPDPSSPLNDVSTWIKIMEYMAYGKPIVSFDLKETRFSARDACIFVPCNDELAFAQAIAKLMDNGDLREKMGRYGRARVETELQWSVVRGNLLRAYAAL